MPKRNTIEVIINARDNASSTLNALAGNTQRIGGVITAAFAGAAVAVGASMAVMVNRGLDEFQRFETGMNEVFTLLPDISQAAMDVMERRVQQFSARFGTLSEDVVPALYQALSAGVPEDNVFEFLEVAQMAAIGGVTDLETAVDGISSVVNAYGADVMSAAEASDFLFTAMRLGKTDIGQLSAVVSQFAPQAASMGIAFDEALAAVTAITTTGTPTSVAANQIQKAMLELGDAGSEAGKIFQEMSGQTLREFTAAGGDFQGALAIMAEAAEASGVSIDQLFGSVEAGSAALSLTETVADTFNTVLDEMASSAGATEGAFDTMNQGIGRSLAMLQARVQNMFINIGALAAPLITPIIAIFSTFANILSRAFGEGEFLSDSLMDLPKFLRPLGIIVGKVAAGFRAFARELDPNNENGFFGALNAGVPIFAVVMVTMRRVLKAMGVGTKTINKINQAIIKFKLGFDKAKDVLKDFIKPIADFVKRNVKLKDVLIAVGIAVASFVLPVLFGIVVAIAPIIAAFAALVAVVALVRTAWESNFGGIRDIVQALREQFEVFAAWFENAGFTRGMQLLFTTFEDGSSAIGELLKIFGVSAETADKVGSTINAVVNGIASAFQSFWNLVKPILTSFWEWFTSGGFTQIKDAVTGFVSGAWNILVAAFTGAWNLIKPVRDIVQALREQFEVFAAWFENAGFTRGMQLLFTTFEDGSSAIGELLKIFGVSAETADKVGSTINAVVNGIASAFQSFWNLVKPILTQFKDWFVTTGFPLIKTAVTDFITNYWNILVAAFTGAWNLIKPVLDNIWNWFQGEQFQGIKTTITDFISGAWSNLTTAIEQIWTTIEPILTQFKDWFVATGFPLIKTAVTDFITNYWNVLKDGILLFWDLISPILTLFWDWFTTTAFPAIKTAITDFVVNYWTVLQDGILLFWGLISPILTQFKDWFSTGGFQQIKDAINLFITATWNVLVAAFTGAWDLISAGVSALKDGLTTAFNFIKDNVIQPVIDRINDVINLFGTAKDTLSQGLGGEGGGILDYTPVGIVQQGFDAAQRTLGFQFGGNVSAGVPVRVGEGGAETFVPNQDGEILNAQDTAAMGNGQNITIQFVFQRDITDAEARESAQKLKRELQAQGISVEGTF